MAKIGGWSGLFSSFNREEILLSKKAFFFNVHWALYLFRLWFIFHQIATIQRPPPHLHPVIGFCLTGAVNGSPVIVWVNWCSDWFLWKWEEGAAVLFFSPLRSGTASLSAACWLCNWFLWVWRRHPTFPYKKEQWARLRVIKGETLITGCLCVCWGCSGRCGFQSKERLGW